MSALTPTEQYFVRLYTIPTPAESWAAYEGGGVASITYLPFMGPVVIMTNEQCVKTHNNR